MIVKITAKEENIEEMISAMKVMQSAAQAETGCIRYQFYQDRKETNVFFVYEVYQDKDAFLFHANSDHIKAYMATTANFVTVVDMHKLNAI